MRVAGIDYATAVSESADMMQELHVFGTEDVARERLARPRRAQPPPVVSFQRLNGVVSPLFQALPCWCRRCDRGRLRRRERAAGVARCDRADRRPRRSATARVSRAPTRASTRSRRTRACSPPNASGSPASAPQRGDTRVDRIDEIEAIDVAYSYDHSRRFALSDVSFTVRRGQVVGIVGPSGSGKSTLVQLLLRLRDPTAGRILVDGLDAA